MKKIILGLIIITLFFGCIQPASDQNATQEQAFDTKEDVKMDKENKKMEETIEDKIEKEEVKENEEEISMDQMMNDMMKTHIGCQEGEVDEFGNCWPAEQKNASIFKDVNVIVEDVEFGYLAKPMKEGNYPGIIMIHEWWGLNQNVKDMARVLAKEGYIVYAVDLYGGNVAEDSNAARQYATAVRSNPQGAVDTMKKAVMYLFEKEKATNVGSIGWCFGGQFSLELALNEPKMSATVIYYGSLTDDTNRLKNINWPVLGIFGSEDTSITIDSVNAFESALNEVGIENEIKIYEGVGHAFANPSGTRYAQKETIDAWNKTVNFFNDNLKKEEVLSFVDVSPAKAKELIDTVEDLVVIDVSPHYDNGHLPGAIHYYLGDGSLDAAIPTLDKSKTYLVYCHVDSVAIAGAQRLIDAGFTKVYRLEGNYGAWVDAGYEVEK